MYHDAQEHNTGKKEERMKRVLVIGGGAAGMTAAISAAEHGHAVTLLEQNEKLGKSKIARLKR